MKRQASGSQALAWLLGAEAISFAGSRISFLAVPWLVLETTGSAAQTGLVVFAEMLPYVLASALGGPIIDQRGPRRMSIGADIASAVAVSLIPLLQRADLLPLAALVAVIAVAGALRGFGDTAKRALLPGAVEASRVDMARANGLHDGVDRLSLLLGGAVGGVLLAWLGAANVLLVDAASFAVAALVIASGVRVAQDPSQPAEAREPYGAAFRAGFEYLRHDKLTLGIAVLVTVTNLLDQAHAAVFVPVWVRDTLDSPQALGLVFASLGLGAVVGNLVFAALAPRLPRYATFSLCFVLGGAPHIIVMGLTDSLVTVTAVLFASGVACAAINPILAAVVYERIPSHLRARVLGLTRALAWAGIPLGGLLGGLAIEGLGLTPSLLLTGGIYLAVTLVPFVQPLWRELDRPGVSPRPEIEQALTA